jgi:hypothetical protein
LEKRPRHELGRVRSPRRSTRRPLASRPQPERSSGAARRRPRSRRRQPTAGPAARPTGRAVLKPRGANSEALTPPSASE